MTAPVHPLTVSSGTAAKLTPDAEDGRQAFALTERQTARSRVAPCSCVT